MKLHDVERSTKNLKSQTEAVRKSSFIMQLSDRNGFLSRVMKILLRTVASLAWHEKSF